MGRSHWGGPLTRPRIPAVKAETSRSVTRSGFYLRVLFASVDVCLGFSLLVVDENKPIFFFLEIWRKMVLLGDTSAKNLPVCSNTAPKPGRITSGGGSEEDEEIRDGNIASVQSGSEKRYKIHSKTSCCITRSIRQTSACSASRFALAADSSATADAAQTHTHHAKSPSWSPRGWQTVTHRGLCQQGTAGTPLCCSETIPRPPQICTPFALRPDRRFCHARA